MGKEDYREWIESLRRPDTGMMRIGTANHCGRSSAIPLCVELDAEQYIKLLDAGTKPPKLVG